MIGWISFPALIWAILPCGNLVLNPDLMERQIDQLSLYWQYFSTMISQFIPSILLLHIYNATIKAPLGTVGQWPYIYIIICKIIYTSIIIYIYTHLCVYIHVIPDYWPDYITTYTSPLCSNDIANITRIYSFLTHYILCYHILPFLRKALSNGMM